MTRDGWHLPRVELVGGPVEIDRPPGRDFLIGSDHTFGDLADAIDGAFDRWDLSHLHEFVGGGNVVAKATGRSKRAASKKEVDEYRHDEATRLNNPEAGSGSNPPPRRWHQPAIRGG